MIFDPWTTTTDAATNKVTRPSRLVRGIFDYIKKSSATIVRIYALYEPLKVFFYIGGLLILLGIAGWVRIMYFWAFQNNFQTSYGWPMRYWNFSERVDWNASDKLKVFGRYSRVRTDLESDNFANSPAVENDNGGIMNSRNIVGDVVYTMSARTVLNFRMGVVYSEDEYDSDWAKLGEAGLAKYWPNNPWYKPYTADMPAVYYPNLNIGGATFGKSSWWSYRPRKYSYQGSMGHDRGRHYMKFGMAYRHAYEYSQLPNLGTFPFTANLTADTYNAPNTLIYGSA